MSSPGGKGFDIDWLWRLSIVRERHLMVPGTGLW